MGRESSLPFAREIITEESDALKRMAGLLDEQFDAAVSLISELAPGGRLVVSGMGKAGFIAMKASATFASIGVPSFFLHPAEAIHGDLGRFARHDIALIFSNSGETPEVLRLVPFVKRIGCPLVTVTGKPGSNLAQHSDVVLLTGEHGEAGPLGLAPTTSTTAMLALGDALAMALLKVRGLTREEFARYHPGGNIGRSLMLVSDVMRTGECHCVVAGTAVAREVLHRYSATKGRPGAATVVDGAGKLAGIFTDGNLRRELDRGTEFLERPIAELMTRNPKTVLPNQLVEEALRIMSEHKIDQLVVVDEAGCPAGLVDIQDLIELGGPGTRG